MLLIAVPLTERQAQAVTIAADRFGVAAWEIAVHVLALRQRLALTRGVE